MDEYNHNKQKEWKAVDFERYYKNNMPPEERHALEKAALKDPFLQDALEGFEFTHTPVEDVQMLKKKLTQGRDKATVLWYQQPATSRLLKAAAVLVFIASFTWILLSKNSSVDSELAAVQYNQSTTSPVDVESSKMPAEAITQDTFAALGDKNLNTNNIAKANADLTIIKPADIAKTEVAELASTPVTNAALMAKNIDAEIKKTDSIELVNIGLASAAKKTINKTNLDVVGDAEGAGSTRVIRGRVLDTDGAPVPYARINGDASGQVLASNKEGYFSLNNGANTVNVNVNALGYETTTAILTPDNPENKIILKETQNLALINNRAGATFKNRVEKEDLSVKAGQRISGQKIKKNVPSISLVNAVPIEGIIKYNEHVKKMLVGESQPLMKGEITLSFHIDSAGRPTNIKILKSLQPGADSTAVNILKNALPLKPVSKNKVSTATIRFE